LPRIDEIGLHRVKTALLIDDDPVGRSLIGRVLASEGWQVLEAADGRHGLELAYQHRPALIVCDLRMPQGDGVQVCQAARQRAELSHSKIIVTTRPGHDSNRDRALAAGADVFLVKPINLADFAALVGQLTTPGSPATPPLIQAGDSGAALPVRVRFWGVRGSIPAPGPSTMVYGGNTSCVELRAEEQIIVLDAGTGVRPLGIALAEEFGGRPLDLTMLISHTHWDHIQGFPFFQPAYNPNNKLRILGYEGARKGLVATLNSQMESPFFPVGLRQMPGNIAIEELQDLQFDLGRIKVRAAFMNHPGVTMGYRFYTREGSIAFLPDNEPFVRLKTQAAYPAKVDTEVVRFARAQDQKIIEFVRDAEVVIMDAQYDCEEYAHHVGWGHGCVDDVVALALAARVKRLFLFHHDPAHSDEKVAGLLARARERVAAQGSAMEVEAAREGMEVRLRSVDAVAASQT
jgi:phosphoribosyl 1,2-cyclic phosphodiesterase/ActR/RegA family two-component response regulator